MGMPRVRASQGTGRRPVPFGAPARGVTPSRRLAAVALAAVLGLVPGAVPALGARAEASGRGSAGDDGVTPQLAAWAASLRALADVDPPSPTEPAAELVLEQNTGQFDPAVDFVARGDDATIFLADGALTFDTHDGVDAQAVRMSLVGADPAVVPVVSDADEATVNYFIGADPERWVVEAPTAAAVEYPDLLTGVDLRYLGTDGGLRYDVALDPGIDPGNVVFRFDGADAVHVDDMGRLVVEVSVGDDLVFSPPVTFQPSDSGPIAVESAYAVVDATTIGFTVADHDPTLPLVIDPTVSFTTYIGGASDDDVVDVVLDASGNQYLVGTSTSTAYPTTVGAYDTTSNGNGDVVVTKLDPTGATVLWSTFLGGALALDDAVSAAMGLDGGVVVAVQTQSTDFPTTTGAYDRTHNGNVDVAVARIASTGSTLSFSSYIGSSGSDYALGVDVDTTDRIVVGGYTTSVSYPLTAGVVDTGFGGTYEAFLTKVATGGASLAVSTFLGNAGNDILYALDVDSTDDVHVVLGTDSTIGTTVGAYDTTYNGGSDVAYARLPSTAASLEYATYLGGTAQDVPTSVAAYTNTNVTVGGYTFGSTFPTTSGASDTTFAGTTEGFVSRLDTTFSGTAQLRYATFLGGTGVEIVYGIGLDVAGRAVAVGSTTSSGIATSGAPDTTYAGGTDAFAAVVDTGGSGTRVLTYLGGTGLDEAYGAAVATTNAFVVVGATGSSDLTTTGGAYDTSLGGSTDGFVARYTALVAPNAIEVNSTGDGADASAGNGRCETSTASQCTLRAAIAEADASAAIDTIRFAIPTIDSGHLSGVWTITPGSALPTVAQSVTIDGSSQSGYATTPVISINGASLGSTGFTVSGSSVTMRALNLRSAPNDGVTVSGSGFHLENSHIGTNAAGTAAAANIGVGLALSGADAVISGNLVSGNGRDGIILNLGADRALLVNNRIGTTVTGNAALANGQEGIELNSADDVVIGQPGNGNVISGNLYAAINAWTGSPDRAIVQANKIGIGADGTTSVPNSSSVSEGGIAVRTAANDWLIGGDDPSEANLFANNVNNGVQFEAVNGTADDIAIIGNSIKSHSGLGIDIDRNGVTANDLNDADTGINGRLNFPAITSARADVSTIDVTYTLNVPAGNYRVEFFDNDVADATGYGEGQTHRGSTPVTHPGGTATYTATIPGSSGDIIAATTTEDLGGGTYGSTSEFSAVATAAIRYVTVNSGAEGSDVSQGNGVCQTATVGQCTLRAAIEEANASAAIDVIRFAIPTADTRYRLPGACSPSPRPARSRRSAPVCGSSARRRPRASATPTRARSATSARSVPATTGSTRPGTSRPSTACLVRRSRSRWAVVPAS